MTNLTELQAKRPVRKRDMKPESTTQYGDWEPNNRSFYTGNSRTGSTRNLTGFVLTERDRALVRFAGRYRYTTVLALTILTSASAPKISARLRLLRRGGLLRSQVAGGQTVWYPTPAGMRFADTDLKAIKPEHVTSHAIAHTLAITLIGAQFERDGYATTTEAEFIAGLAGERVAGEHRPDLVVEQRSGKLAIEIEFSRKSLVDQRKVLRWYGKHPEYSPLYLTPKKHIATLVKATAAQLQVPVAVSKWAPEG